MRPLRVLLLSGLALSGLLMVSSAAVAQTVVSANDGHTLLEHGVQVLPRPVLHDSLSTLTRGADGLWRVVANVDVPASVVGPPTGLTLTLDGHYAIVSSASKADPAGGKIVPDDRVSVVDLKGAAPRVVQTVQARPGATSVRLTPDGTHLMVANGKSGSISWFSFRDGHLSNEKVLMMPVEGGFVGGVAISADGKKAFVSLWKGDLVFTINIDGDDLHIDPSPILLAPGAWTMRLTPDGKYASVNVLGHGEGLPGAIAMLDLRGPSLKVVDRVVVPNAPEGTDISPDGRYLAVVSQNGSALPESSARYHARGIVTVFALNNGHLKQVAQAPGALWPQGLVFSPDGKEIITQGAVDHKLRTLSWNGKVLKVQGDTDLPGAGADLERQR